MPRPRKPSPTPTRTPDPRPAQGQRPTAGRGAATLASYRHGVVRFDAQALRDVRVSGVFKLDDSAAALSALADNLPIRVEYFTDLLVVVKPR